MKITKVSRVNPVKKNMDKFHRPSTHPDKTKYNRKTEDEARRDIERMIDEGAPTHVDYRDVQRKMTDLNWDGE